MSATCDKNMIEITFKTCSLADWDLPISGHMSKIIYKLSGDTRKKDPTII